MDWKFIVVLVLIGSPVALAQEGEDGPQEVNPFSTPSSVGPSSVAQIPVATSLDGFEFNGIMEMRGKLRISIYDTRESRNYWITEGQLAPNGVSFQRFDDESKTVVIVQGGVSKKLALNEVKIESLRPVAINPGPGPATTSQAAVGSARPQPNAETDEQARIRIQRVAEEIRMRRAERRKQLEQGRGRTN